MSGRVAVLLGAGASVDAELPLTVELARMLVEKANDSVPFYAEASAPWVRALNFVYGAQVGYQSSRGDSPLREVNVERLISAIRLLQNPESHEVAPFVDRWNPSVWNLGSASRRGRNAKKALEAISKHFSGSSFADDDFHDAISGIARLAQGDRSGEVFRRTEQEALRILTELLHVDLESVGYLEPLTDLAKNQPGGLDVITLNYDLAVELACQRFETPVYRGVSNWLTSNPLGFEALDGQLNLYKLHGSLDWRVKRESTLVDPPQIYEQSDHADDRGHADPPWIVVGDKEKLSNWGPTLDLVHASTRALNIAEKLVVIGYSFSDAHINNMINDWMRGKGTRRLVILDPGWTNWSRKSLPWELAGRYGPSSPVQSSSRIAVLEVGCAEGLAEALATEPIEQGAQGLSLKEVSVQTDHIEFEIVNLGVSLYETGVSVPFLPRLQGHQGVFDVLEDLRKVVRESPQGSHGFKRNVVSSEWPNGESRTFFVPHDRSIQSIPIEVHACFNVSTRTHLALQIELDVEG